MSSTLKLRPMLVPFAMTCQIYGCGHEIEVTEDEFRRKRFLGDCPKCGCPQWPVDLGFTGNDPKSVKEFAANHNIDGTPIVDFDPEERSEE